MEHLGFTLPQLAKGEGDKGVAGGDTRGFDEGLMEGIKDRGVIVVSLREFIELACQGILTEPYPIFRDFGGVKRICPRLLFSKARRPPQRLEPCLKLPFDLSLWENLAGVFGEEIATRLDETPEPWLGVEVVGRERLSEFLDMLEAWWQKEGFRNIEEALGIALFLLNPLYPPLHIRETILDFLESLLVKWNYPSSFFGLFEWAVLALSPAAAARYMKDPRVTVAAEGSVTFVEGRIPFEGGRIVANERVRPERVLNVLRGILNERTFWPPVAHFLTDGRILFLDGNNRLCALLLVEFIGQFFEGIISGRMELEATVEAFVEGFGLRGALAENFRLTALKLFRERFREIRDMIGESAFLREAFGGSSLLLPAVVSQEETFMTLNPRTRSGIPSWVQQWLVKNAESFPPKGQTHGRSIVWPVYPI